MSEAKFKVEKFDGSNDFGLWKIKIKALLVQNDLEGALKGERKLPATLSPEEKKMVMSKALSTIQLSLSNKVLRQLKMNPGTFVGDHMHLFNQIVMYLANMDVNIEDEDQALLLSCSLSEAYESFVDTMLHGRTSITLEDVKASLNSKELHKKVLRGDILTATCDGNVGAKILTISEGGEVLMANGDKCDVVGVREVQIKLHIGSVILLGDVKHVPGLKKNLISLGTVDKLGYKYRCRGGVVGILKGALVVIKGLL
ncbi:hypothetical protein CRG98_020689 [Punica granatum]|uniref:Retrovirus-related Pol polyprotein from transposon TNT 1-94-like beta-barrel domain-containing protein n=1 Tax=Punica granatum TaxID=22663 RepID=A0A2I0JSU1_PUNGR|nr:hypothetical protein CRG98_020689 [Punica granatum]